MNKRAELTKIGIYIVIALVLIKFAVKPLNARLEQNKEMLTEIKQSYSLKQQIYERKLYEAQKPATEPESLSMLYSKNFSYNSIRNKVLQWLMENAEKKGLTITNFEIPEIKKGKELTEINVLLRLKGSLKPFLEYLEGVESADKLILIKNLELNPSGKEFNITVTFSFFRRES